MEYELRHIDTANGRRGVLVVSTGATVRVGLEDLARLRADESISQRDAALEELARDHEGLASGWIFAGTTPNGTWRLDPELSDEETAELAFLLFRSHVRLYRVLVRYGFRLHAYAQWPDRELEVFARATQEVATALEYQLGYARMTPPHEHLAQLELDSWIMTRLTVFCRQPLGPGLWSFFGEHLPRFEGRAERIATLLSRVDGLDSVRTLVPMAPLASAPVPSLTLGPSMVSVDEVEVRELLLADQRDARDIARASLESRTTMLANVSHELRTPIHGIIGMADLMDADAMSQADRDRLGTIRRCADSLTILLDDLLDASRLELGGLIFNESKADLRRIITDSIAVFGARAVSREIVFTHVDEGESGPVLALVDADRLGQVLRNLIGNALKFTDLGGAVEVKSDVSVDETDGTATLRFLVSDTGPGISRSDVDRIFEPFFQTDAGTARRLNGAGLGLSICRRIIDRMMGDLWVRSVPGIGSTFGVQVSLPLWAKDVERRPLPSEPQTEPRTLDAIEAALAIRVAEDGSTGRILVVDDDAVNRAVLIAYLTRAGLQCLATDSGSSAVALAATERFPLIFMDCQMPGMDGYEATARLRAAELATQRPAASIIVITAHTDSHQHDAALEAGADRIVVKPADRETILRVVLEVLEDQAGIEPVV